MCAHALDTMVLHLSLSRAHCRVPEECSDSIAAMVAACLLDDPDQRPTARDLVDKLSKAAQEGASGGRSRSKRPSVVGRAQPLSVHTIALYATSLSCNVQW